MEYDLSINVVHLCGTVRDCKLCGDALSVIDFHGKSRGERVFYLFLTSLVSKFYVFFFH